MSQSSIDALKNGIAFKANGMIEDVVKLHWRSWRWRSPATTAASATLQWGDGTDGTKYSVPSNATLGWPFHHLSHRVDSDASDRHQPDRRGGPRGDRRAAHAVAAARPGPFKARGLQDKAIILWTNHIADGPCHSARNVPHIIWGNGGGYLKQGRSSTPAT